MTTGRKTPRSTSTPEEGVLDAFKAFRSVVLRDSMRQTIKFLHERNLSLAAVATLIVLRDRGDQTISTLAREIGLSVAATSQLVERLVQDDLVRRTEHPADRRRRQVALTAKGKTLSAKVDGSHVAAAVTVLGRASAASLKRLEAALAEVTQAVSDPS